MNNENKGKQMLYQSSPAVAALNKVPGFEPLKLLRRTVSDKTQEPMFRLDLPYKKLWFRLANPQGCIRVNALRVTEQMAVYEAQVFLSREDTQSLVAFTASCNKEDAPNGRYIEAAQWAAVNEALTDAGYGLQFADVTMRPEDRRYGSAVSLDVAQKLAQNAAAEKAQPVQAQMAPVQQPKPVAAAPVQKAQPTPVQAAPIQKAQTVPVVQKEQPAVAQPANAIPMTQPANVELVEQPAAPVQAAIPAQPAPTRQPEPVIVAPIQKEQSVPVVQQPAAPAQPAPALTVEQAKPETPAAVEVMAVPAKTDPSPQQKPPPIPRKPRWMRS